MGAHLSAWTDTQKALGKVGGASLATLVLAGALQQNTWAVQSLEATIVRQNETRVEQLEERQKALDREREEREKRQREELALAKDSTDTLRRLLELREAETARLGGSR